ncbi:helix-turn-helix domain-containing protein [Escherichia coli]|nr:helix-turn-helix domain-containing protein [Escherichia coli]
MSSLSGEDFRRLRKLIGVTQSQFASLLDVDVKTVSRIERGYCRISARMAFALHFVYGVYRNIHTEHQIQEFEKKSVNVNKCCVNQNRLQQQNAGSKGSYAQQILVLLMAQGNAKRKSAGNGVFCWLLPCIYT